MTNAIHANPFCEGTKNAHAPFNDHLCIYPVTLEHNNYAYPGRLCKIYIHVRWETRDKLKALLFYGFIQPPQSMAFVRIFLLIYSVLKLIYWNCICADHSIHIYIVLLSLLIQILKHCALFECYYLLLLWIERRNFVLILAVSITVQHVRVVNIVSTENIAGMFTADSSRNILLTSIIAGAAL